MTQIWTKKNLAPFIREMEANDLDAVVEFADRQIGENYFSKYRIEEIFKTSTKNGLSATLVLVDDDGIQGIRLTYPPHQWLARLPGQLVHPQLWKVALQDTAYFQSLFVAKKYQGQGWGPRLSMAAVEKLKAMGAKAVVCHSWNESPQDSSRKYLDGLGFQAVISIPNYWKGIDYECTRCGKPPCLCSATEMIFYI